MDSVLQCIFITLVLSLMCTSTFVTATTAQTLFDQCEFDPKFEYTTTSTFKVYASNPLKRTIQWTYDFDVRNQTVDLRHERRGPPKETILVRFDYMTHTISNSCDPYDNEGSIINNRREPINFEAKFLRKKLRPTHAAGGNISTMNNASFTEPTYNETVDLKKCSQHCPPRIYWSYFQTCVPLTHLRPYFNSFLEGNVDYDFWFSIKVTSQGKCQMHEIALPGQFKPNRDCLTWKDFPIDQFWREMCPTK